MRNSTPLDVVVLLARTGEFLEDLEEERSRIVSPLVRFQATRPVDQNELRWTTVQ